MQTLLGESEFNLTIPSVELIISKSIVIASAGTLTPYIAGQYVWFLGDSELVDLTPQTDAASAMADTGSPDDYNNNGVFSQVRASRIRGVIGAQGRYGVLTITGAVAFDLNQVDDPTSEEPNKRLPRQWTANFGLGLSF